jgi:hypothetical protein
MDYSNVKISSNIKCLDFTLWKECVEKVHICVKRIHNWNCEIGQLYIV